MLKNEGSILKKVIVCTPLHEYYRVSNLVEQHMHEIPDLEPTLYQFEILKSTLAKSGAEIIDASELKNHPNSVFIRDAALCTPKGYIQLRMGLKARRGEEIWAASILDSIGEPCAGRITAPGTVEGGDVILAGSVAFVGLSARTNQQGVRQLSKLLEEMDYEVRTMPIDDTILHLGGIMSAIAPERILCCRDAFPKNYFKNFDTVEIDCTGPSNGNVICLRENEVIANSVENMETINLLEKSGVRVHPIDLSEFRKGAGGPTCLILPVERG